MFFGNIWLKNGGGAQKFQDKIFSQYIKQYRIVKFEIGIWGCLTFVNLLYPFGMILGDKAPLGGSLVKAVKKSVSSPILQVGSTSFF